MSPAMTISLVIAAVAIAVLIALAVALVRQLRGLAATLSRYQEEVEPLLREIQAESVRLQERAEAVPERMARMRADGRLRR